MLESKEVEAVLEELNVLVVTADNTDGGALIKNDYARANRKSLPVNLIYPADETQPAIMMPEILTKDDVIEALRRAAQ